MSNSIVTTLPGGVRVKVPKSSLKTGRARTRSKEARRNSSRNSSRSSQSSRRSNSRNGGRRSSHPVNKSRNRNNRSGGDQPSKRGLRQQLSVPSVSQQVKYLYGFIDPTANVTRGPNRSPYPTFPFQLSTAMDISLTAGDVTDQTGVNYKPVADKGGSGNTKNWMGDAPYFNGTANSAQYVNNYRSAVVGAPVTICACPHYVRTYGGNPDFPEGVTVAPELAQILSSGLVSAGFICGATDTYGKPMYSNTSYTMTDDYASPPSSIQDQYSDTYDCPLRQFPMRLPLNNPVQQTGKVLDRNWSTKEDPPPVDQDVKTYTTIPWRTTGLSIGVQNTSAPLEARGTVQGGDNRMLYGQSTQSFYEYQATQNFSGQHNYRYQPELNDSATSGVSAPSMDEAVFTGPTMSQSRRDMGAFPSGMYAHSSYIPSSDRILQFRSDTSSMSCMNMPAPDTNVDPSAGGGVSFFNNLDPSSAIAYSMTRGELLMNNPAAYITISGWQSGATYRVYITWNIEIAIATSGPLALLINQARFASNYVVNWSVLQDIMCAGVEGDNMAHAASNPVVASGAMAAIGAATVPAPVMANPVNYQSAVRSYTSRVVERLPPNARQTTAAGLISHAEHGESSVPGAIAETALGGAAMYQNRALLGRIGSFFKNGAMRVGGYMAREAGVAARGIIRNLPKVMSGAVREAPLLLEAL